MSRMIKGAARTVLVLCVVLSLGAIGVGCGGSKTAKVDGSSSDGTSGGRGGRGGGGGGSRGGRPVSEADKARLEEARKAAEAAERELSDLRLERIRLESGQ